MKIIDCFIFHNEIDMLLYRLNILFNYVDYFVIVESRQTHSGHEKKINYHENIHLFEPFVSKIIYVLIDLPHKFPNIDYSKNQQWENENYQRNLIKNGIDQITINDEDIIIVSDLDEIPDSNIISLIKNNKLVINTMYSLEQDLYYYNLNTRFVQKWNASKILPYKIYKENNLTFQNIRHCGCGKIFKGGWHLSYFGDKHFIKNKIQQFAHQEYNNNNYTDLDNIEARVKCQTDIYDRNEQIEKISIKDNDYLPVEYEKYLSKYILY